MPRSKRVALSVPHEIDTIFDDIARLQNRPKSTVIMDFLCGVYPAAVQLRDALQAVEDGRSPNKALAALYASLSAQYAGMVQQYTAISDD